MTTYAYARVSTEQQSLDLQLDALEKHGYDNLYQEKESSRNTRPELEKLKSKLEAGDTLVVYKSDRLARSTVELIMLVDGLNENNINFVDITQKIDTRTPQGAFYFTIIAGMAQFERSMISERTKEGLKAAKARGRLGGRPKGMEKKVVNICKLVQHEANANEELSISSLLKTYSVSRHSYYKFLKVQKEGVVEVQEELKIGGK